MWLTFVMMILSFVLTKASGGSTKKALGVAALTGAATYLAVERTETGKDLSNSFDNFLGVNNENEPPIAAAVGTGTNSAAGTGSTGLGSALGGLWNSLGGVGQAAVGVGAGVALGSFFNKYGIWILGGVGVYLLTDD